MRSQVGEAGKITEYEETIRKFRVQANVHTSERTPLARQPFIMEITPFFDEQRGN